MFSLIKTDEQDVYASHIFAINISQDSKIKVIDFNQNYDKLISVNFYENIIKNGEEIKDRRLYILNRDSEKWVTKNNTKGIDFLINSCEKDIFDLIENDNFNNHEILQKCKKIHEKFIILQWYMQLLLWKVTQYTTKHRFDFQVIPIFNQF